MVKRLKLLILGMFLFCLTGCAGQTQEKLDLGGLQNQAGDYQFGDLEWGSSKEATEAALGVTLEETLSSSEEFQAYMVSDVFRWQGKDAILFVEFEKEKLTAISFRFNSQEESDSTWQDLSEELLAAYGSVEPQVRNSESQELSMTMESESYLWEQNNVQHTILQLAKSTVNGEFKGITLTVSLVTK